MIFPLQRPRPLVFAVGVLRKRPERLEDTLRPYAEPSGIEVTVEVVRLGCGPAAYVS